ncbi:uncharacterized protein EDB93DRAFT_1079925 [Suillus bovinus]|uniref:uncharacterized protein n=1 Tax=Suillus bovinus TaxID=48563 RepID=UPI001B8738CE|nr:uncharacterized protein EDB93DRAFT_1079925 [Suillus bovinus]KAG2155865.1 hypothetical protein EDB93DRAFT_1079925 [Suillus bovinus]
MATTSTSSEKLSTKNSWCRSDWVLNREGCCIKTAEGKGRGVYASRIIPSQTVIEVSPVLLFTRTEYDNYGRHTILDHYAFKWRDGRMALALGLGSLFNHSSNPNVSYTIDPAHDCIKYTTTRTINPEEELCIFYGHNLWFDPVGATENLEPQVCLDQSDQSELLHIMAIDSEVDEVDIQPWNTGDLKDIVEAEALPFLWKKLQIDEEEESIEEVRTMQAWAVDIPDSKHIATMLKWLKQSGLESDALSHLKRIRKRDSISTLLLSVSSSVPLLPTNVDIGDPYQISVPCNPALTQTSLILKNTLWPTVYAPRRKWEPEKWSTAKVQWARDAISHVLRNSAQITDELPVVAYVPKPFEDKALLSRSFTANDTRISTGHPLRHAAMNIIRNIADWRAKTTPADLLADPVKPATSPSNTSLENSDTSCNGANYLLTGLTLFITHEPCIMCSMALLHSRVKEVFYIVPMPRTGGCGGSACLPALKGVNHRYSIAQWRQREGSAAPAHLDEQVDA